MYQHIVVALDGSDFAERVFEFVRPLADKFGSSVTLVRATTSPESIMSMPSADMIAAEPMIDPTPIVEADQAAAREYLAVASQRFGVAGPGVTVAMPEGDPARVLVAYAAEHGADLIAITTHGHSGLARLLYGSVAEGVIRHAPCPVLLVRIPEEHRRSD